MYMVRSDFGEFHIEEIRKAKHESECNIGSNSKNYGMAKIQTGFFVMNDRYC
jgi:hypothetical protein